MDKRDNKGTYSPEDLSPDVRRRLGEAVLDIFSEVDFHRANMRTVAKKAGVSFSSVYKYYGSKEKLLFSFIDDWMKELAERVIDHLQGIEDIKEKLRKAFWVQLDFYERNPHIGRIIFLTVPWKTWMSHRTFKQKKMMDIYVNVLREGQETGYLNSSVRAGTLLDFMHGLVWRSFTMWLYRGQREGLASQANVIFEMIWRAISNPGR
jgi:AcrR family transcriptional regulator